MWEELINPGVSTETTIVMTAPASIFIGRKASARRAVDPDVRALLREYLEDVHKGTDTRLLEELGLCQGDAGAGVPAANRAAVRAETAQATRQERDIRDTPSLFEFFETGNGTV